MPGKILAIVHQKHSRTRRVGRLLRQMGYELDIRRPCLGRTLPETLDAHAGTVVFGGPMSAYEEDKYDFIKRELDWIPMAVESGKPYLGICLGAQMLAHALGAKVETHPEGLFEVGYFPFYRTEAGAEVFDLPVMHAYQWHKDGFHVPASAVLLARGDCFENQAFRYGRNAFAVQFHPELTPKTMEKWSGFAHKRNLPGAQPLDQLIATRDQHEPSVRRWLARFLTNWLAAPARAAR
jgi:GMP synthase (glutamine-hydrolysing)